MISNYFFYYVLHSRQHHHHEPSIGANETESDVKGHVKITIKSKDDDAYVKDNLTESEVEELLRVDDDETRIQLKTGKKSNSSDDSFNHFKTWTRQYWRQHMYNFTVLPCIYIISQLLVHPVPCSLKTLFVSLTLNYLCSILICCDGWWSWVCEDVLWLGDQRVGCHSLQWNQTPPSSLLHHCCCHWCCSTMQQHHHQLLSTTQSNNMSTNTTVLLLGTFPINLYPLS